MNTTVCSLPHDENGRLPDPRFSMLPTMSLAMTGDRAASDFDSRFFAADGLFMPSGRAALAVALGEAGCGPGDIVLLPAYHCESIVAAVRWLGAEPRFFNLQPDLSPDTTDLQRHLASGVRAVVLVHYFGFPQDARQLREWCDAHRVSLIEDCAHTFFGRREHELPGTAGHYAIASTRKFFPGADGGVVVTQGGKPPDIALRAPDWSAQIKGSAACLQRAADAGKLGIVSGSLSAFFAFVDRRRANGAGGQAQGTAGEIAANTAGADDWFDPEEMQRSGRAVSRWLIRRSDVSRVTVNRRRNYDALLQGLGDVVNARPLYDRLPDNVVPYVFPWIIEAPQEHFPALKAAGVPMYRWEVLTGSDCPVSTRYQYQLLQLPCHQELETDDLDWLIDRCRHLLGAR